MKHSSILTTSILQFIAKPLNTLRCIPGVTIRAALTITFFVLVAICPAYQKPRISPPKTIQLPEPRLTGPASLEQALFERRSIRQFTDLPLNLTQLGQLAWAGQGITEKHRGFRTAPSAGAIYPIILYLATEQGLFVYHPNKHSLERILSRDIRDNLAAAALRQQAVAEAACDIIIAGNVQKVAAKYGKKAQRFMLLEAGHIAQNIQLQAVSLELGSVTIGAFNIARLSKICRLPANLEPLYIIAVGHPAGTRLQ